MSVLNELVKEREEWVVQNKTRERRRKIIEYGVLLLVAAVVVINYESIMSGLSELMRSWIFRH